MKQTCDHCGIEIEESAYATLTVHRRESPSGIITGVGHGTICHECDDELRTWLAAGAARIRENG